MSPRALLRVPFVALATLFAHTTILASVLLRPIAPRLQLRIRNAAFRRWGRQLCRLMGARIEVQGRPPTGEFVLVSNHLSYVDIIVLASQIEAAFVAKASLRRWPLLGWAFQTADTIFIDRARKKDLLRVLQAVHRQLDRGLGVLIFPEGTSSKGEEILRLKPSLLRLAAERDYPVHYVTLSYRTPGGAPAHRTVCWWDDTPFLTHVLRLLGLPYFEVTLRFGAEPIRAGDRKLLADQLQSAMEQSFTPVT